MRMTRTSIFLLMAMSAACSAASAATKTTSQPGIYANVPNPTSSGTYDSSGTLLTPSVAQQSTPVVSGGTGSQSTIAVASETDAAVANTTLPYDVTSLTVKFANSVPPQWYGAYGTYGAELGPVYDHVIRIYTPSGALAQTIHFGALNNAPYGRIGGKDCGYYDCQRGYTDYEFTDTGDPQQANYYPQIDPNSTAAVTLYGVPALSYLTFGTEFSLEKWSTPTATPVINGGPYVAQGGATLGCDTRYCGPITVRNRSSWKANYVVSGTPATTLQASASVCAPKSFTWGNAPTCSYTTPTGALGSEDKGSFDAGLVTSGRVTCSYDFYCQADYTKVGAPTTWVPASLTQKAVSGGTICSTCAIP